MTSDYPFNNLPLDEMDQTVAASALRAAGVQSGTIVGAGPNKEILNATYAELVKQLDALLSRRDLAAWIHEAYRQLELWTAVYHSIKRPDDPLFHIREFAPLGRYGWRHVIDVALSNLDPTSRIRRGTPDATDIRSMFSIVVLMYLISEASNALHHFVPYLGEPKCTYDLSSYSIVKIEYPPAGDTLWTNIQEYNASPGHGQIFPQLHPSLDLNSPIMRRLDAFLLSSFGFSLGDAVTCAEFLVRILRGSGTILVQSGPYITQWAADETGLPYQPIEAAFDFFLLTQKKVQTTKQDFLRKARPLRMSHFAGIRLPKLSDVDLLYSHINANQSYIRTADWHILISPSLLGEWRDTVGMRLLHGVRADLKAKASNRAALELIEEAFRKNVFETEVEALLKSKSFLTIRSLREIGAAPARMELPCGEIDVLGFGGAAPTLLVVECKALAGAVDVRTLASDVSVYFGANSYHQKLLRKVDWVKTNIPQIQAEFKARYNVAIPSSVMVKSVLVTLNPHPAKFLQFEHVVLRIDEFTNYLATL